MHVCMSVYVYTKLKKCIHSTSLSKYHNMKNVFHYIILHIFNIVFNNTIDRICISSYSSYVINPPRAKDQFSLLPPQFLT